MEVDIGCETIDRDVGADLRYHTDVFDISSGCIIHFLENMVDRIEGEEVNVGTILSTFKLFRRSCLFLQYSKTILNEFILTLMQKFHIFFIAKKFVHKYVEFGYLLLDFVAAGFYKGVFFLEEEKHISVCCHHLVIV